MRKHIRGIVLVLLILLLPCLVWAEDEPENDIEITLNWGFNGKAGNSDACLPVTATLTNHGEAFEGQLETMDLKQFAGKVRNDFEIPDVRMYGDPAAIIHRVAVSSGSGKSMIRGAIEKGADVIVTGDVDYHSAIDAVAQGIAVIDAGHYGTEYGFIAYMRQELETMFPELAVGTARVHHRTGWCSGS